MCSRCYKEDSISHLYDRIADLEERVRELEERLRKMEMVEVEVKSA